MFPLPGEKGMAEWLRTCASGQTSLVLNICSQICMTWDELVNIPPWKPVFFFSTMGTIAPTTEVL